MPHYVSQLVLRFTDTFYYDPSGSIEDLRNLLSLRFTNFLCGKDMFESFKYLFSHYPISDLGPYFDNFIITYAGSKFICSEKIHSEEVIPFSKIDASILRKLI
jgi:hypothetical protein